MDVWSSMGVRPSVGVFQYWRVDQCGCVVQYVVQYGCVVQYGDVV